MQLGWLLVVATACLRAAGVAVPPLQEKPATSAAQLGAGASAIETKVDPAHNAGPGASHTPTATDKEEEEDTEEEEDAAAMKDVDKELAKENHEAEQRKHENDDEGNGNGNVEAIVPQEHAKVTKYGPNDCISVWSSSEARCVVATNCTKQQEDITDFAVNLFCIEVNGSKTRHVYEPGAFAAQETFDTDIPCPKCIGAGPEPTPPPAWGPAPKGTQTIPRDEENASLQELQTEVLDLKAALVDATSALSVLRERVNSPGFKPINYAESKKSEGKHNKQEKQKEEKQKKHESGNVHLAATVPTWSNKSSPPQSAGQHTRARPARGIVPYPAGEGQPMQHLHARPRTRHRHQHHQSAKAKRNINTLAGVPTEPAILGQRQRHQRQVHLHRTKHHVKRRAGHAGTAPHQRALSLMAMSDRRGSNSTAQAAEGEEQAPVEVEATQTEEATTDAAEEGATDGTEAEPVAETQSFAVQTEAVDDSTAEAAQSSTEDGQEEEQEGKEGDDEVGAEDAEAEEEGQQQQQAEAEDVVGNKGGAADEVGQGDAADEAAGQGDVAEEDGEDSEGAAAAASMKSGDQ